MHQQEWLLSIHSVTLLGMVTVLVLRLVNHALCNTNKLSLIQLLVNFNLKPDFPKFPENLAVTWICLFPNHPRLKNTKLIIKGKIPIMNPGLNI